MIQWLFSDENVFAAFVDHPALLFLCLFKMAQVNQQDQWAVTNVAAADDESSSGEEKTKHRGYKIMSRFYKERNCRKDRVPLSEFEIRHLQHHSSRFRWWLGEHGIDCSDGTLAESVHDFMVVLDGELLALGAAPSIANCKGTAELGKMVDESEERGDDSTDCSATEGVLEDELAATLAACKGKKGVEKQGFEVSVQQMKRGLHLLGMTMKELETEARKNENNAKSSSFERWHLTDECYQFLWILEYYGYLDAELYLQVEDFMDELWTDQERKKAGVPKARRPVMRLTPKVGSEVARPNRCNRKNCIIEEPICVVVGSEVHFHNSKYDWVCSCCGGGCSPPQDALED